jgi:hypothetical protein
VFDAGSSGGSEDADHVEAQDVEFWLVVGEVLFREGADGGLFAGRNGFERIAESRRPAELHLYEDEGLSFADDEVNLAAALPVVAFDEPVAAPGEIAQREVLAPRSAGLGRQSLTPA